MKCIVIQHRYYNRYIVWQLYLWPSTFLPYNLMKLIMYFVTWSIRFIKSETPMNNFNTQDTEIKLTSIFCVLYCSTLSKGLAVGKKCYFIVFMFPEIHAINFNSYWCYLLEIAKLHWCWLLGVACNIALTVLVLSTEDSIPIIVPHWVKVWLLKTKKCYLIVFFVSGNSCYYSFNSCWCYLLDSKTTQVLAIEGTTHSRNIAITPLVLSIYWRYSISKLTFYLLLNTQYCCCDLPQRCMQRF